MNPLNPTLYRRLRKVFGSVKVANEGEAMKAKVGVGLDDKPMLLFSHRGEQYRISCPYCNDTTHRLYISHMYGKRDNSGRQLNFLALCFNEGCMAREENRIDLEDALNAIDLAEAEVKQGVVVSAEAEERDWPGQCYLVNTLKKSHKAVVYLKSRGFDPDVLAKRFQVSYCMESHWFLARDRLIFPVFEYGKLKGWQARYIGELPWKDKEKKKDLPPKYFSCPNSHFRSRCIFNFDAMKQWQTGVIVEGPTDVFRFGAMAGCIFGNSATEFQRRRLLSVFRRRTLILLLDPEEFESESTQRLVRMMSKKLDRDRFAAVKLPEGTDPGSLEKDFVREYVRQEAARVGVKVIYKRVAA